MTERAASPFEAFVRAVAERDESGACEVGLAQQREALAQALVAAAEDARKAWPTIEIETVRFARFLGERAPLDEPLGALSTLRISDLYLACASLRSSSQRAANSAALAAVRSICHQELRRALKRFPSLEADAPDIEQRVLERLVVTTGKRQAGLLGYAGSGDLRSYVRAAVIRMCLNVTTREHREVPEGEAFFDLVLGAIPPAEAEVVRTTCQAEVKAALAMAMSSLPARDRALLRFAYVDGSTVAEIGAVYRVHGATVSRWLAKARRQLLLSLRDLLRERMAISESEAQSVIRTALEGMHITLTRLLGSDAEPGSDAAAGASD